MTYQACHECGGPVDLIYHHDGGDQPPECYQHVRVDPGWTKRWRDPLRDRIHRCPDEPAAPPPVGQLVLGGV